MLKNADASRNNIRYSKHLLVNIYVSFFPMTCVAGSIPVLQIQSIILQAFFFVCVTVFEQYKAYKH